MRKSILGRNKKASQGDNFFVADNPPAGVEFTYYIKEAVKSKKALRKEKEKEMEKNNGTVGVPSWSELDEESREVEPSVWMFIYDQSGAIVRKLEGKNSEGVSRMSWDLSSTCLLYTSPSPRDRG